MSKGQPTPKRVKGNSPAEKKAAKERGAIKFLGILLKPQLQDYKAPRGKGSNSNNSKYRDNAS